MGRRDDKNTAIRDFILQNMRDHPADIVRLSAEKFNFSRPGILKHIHALERAGAIKIVGTTKNRHYELLPRFEQEFDYLITPALVEDKVWRDDMAPMLEGTRKNMLDICHYGFTEIFNNALEHSEGTGVKVHMADWPDRIEIHIVDNGVGIFDKIRRTFGLDDPLHAMLELTKGRLTTDPKRHTGEGIFFVSQMFDRFTILSKGLVFIHNVGRWNWMMEHEAVPDGTLVEMRISPIAERTVMGVFNQFSVDPSNFQFDRTIVPVFLARYGEENLVSRSQARRLLARFDRFQEVILDFERVEEIGQAFADELFRVFQNEHPSVRLVSVNTNGPVAKMIARIRNA